MSNFGYQWGAILNNYDVKFYGDWLFYGGIIASFVFGTIIYNIGKKIGHNNITWRHYAKYGILIVTPAIFLPLWLSPASTIIKIALTVSTIVVFVTHYIFITRKL